MTISKKNNEELMYFASFNTEPDELVLATLSLPAKSTKCNLERRILSEPTALDSKDMENIQWEREDAYIDYINRFNTFEKQIVHKP